MTDQPYLALIYRLTDEQQFLYAHAMAGGWVDPAELQRLESELADAWHHRRLEMSGCSTETPPTLREDRKGLRSIEHKAEKVGRSTFVQAERG